jgi:hypothetical protein
MKKTKPQKPPIQYASQSPEYPSRMDLCTLAAALTNGQPVHSGNARDLISQADALWKASGMFIEHKARLANEQAQREQRDRELHRPIPTPKSYPVSLDEFIRLMMPKMSKTDRMEKLRQFIRERLPMDLAWMAGDMRTSGFAPVTLEQVNERLDQMRTPGLAHGSYEMTAGNFLDWAATKSKATRVDRAHAGGVAKKEKAAAAKAAKAAAEAESRKQKKRP